MGSIQKEMPLFVDGAESCVSSRAPEQDAKEGWSVTVRPYRSKPAEDLLTDYSCNSCTCFLAGNRVLMADGSQKAVEDVQVGDMVMTMSGPDRVRMLERPVLGMTRRVLEIRGVGDECLFVTDEHPLWTSRRTDDGTVENWGVYNLSHYLYEQRNAVEPKIEGAPHALAFDLPEQVAHTTGWLHVRPIYHHMEPSTQLYNIVTTNACSVFVEGFAAYSHGTGRQRPEAGWTGMQADSHAESFVRKFSLQSA
ncbi:MULTISPECIES: Hint domain-containing protein [unclassified Variovorax]|jgi:hypothetical protein|nr:homing endonuclease-like protein [Variovorax sp. CF313]